MEGRVNGGRGKIKNFFSKRLKKKILIMDGKHKKETRKTDKGKRWKRKNRKYMRKEVE